MVRKMYLLAGLVVVGEIGVGAGGLDAAAEQAALHEDEFSRCGSQHDAREGIEEREDGRGRFVNLISLLDQLHPSLPSCAIQLISIFVFYVVRNLSLALRVDGC